MVVSSENRLLSFDPNDGKPLWNADGVHRYVCPSVVTHDDVVYAIGGGSTSLYTRSSAGKWSRRDLYGVTGGNYERPVTNAVAFVIPAP